MRYSTQVKPISYLKANAAEVLQQLTDQREAMIITQNGEARAVIQDVASYEETQETLALLKLLALGNQDVEAGRTRPLADVVKRLRARQSCGSAGSRATLGDAASSTSRDGACRPAQPASRRNGRVRSQRRIGFPRDGCARAPTSGAPVRTKALS